MDGQADGHHAHRLKGTILFLMLLSDEFERPFAYLSPHSHLSTLSPSTIDRWSFPTGRTECTLQMQTRDRSASWLWQISFRRFRICHCKLGHFKIVISSKIHSHPWRLLFFKKLRLHMTKAWIKNPDRKESIKYNARVLSWLVDTTMRVPLAVWLWRVKENWCSAIAQIISSTSKIHTNFFHLRRHKAVFPFLAFAAVFRFSFFSDGWKRA